MSARDEVVSATNLVKAAHEAMAASDYLEDGPAVLLPVLRAQALAQIATTHALLALVDMAQGDSGELQALTEALNRVKAARS